MRDWRDYGIVGEVRRGQPCKAAPYLRALDRREAVARATLEQFFAAAPCAPYVAVSFGVDSLVAYDLARRVCPSMRAAWVNQGPLAEWPDCLAVKDAMVADGMPLDEIAPDVTLYDWYRREGIPFAANMNNAEDGRLNAALLYEPLKRYHARTGSTGAIWGLRWHGEGGHRAFVLKGKGAIYTRKDNGVTYCAPVAHWTKAEVWAYVERHALPYPAFYDRDRTTIRNGPPIGVTGIGQGRVVRLRQIFPEMWRVFCLEFEEIQRYG